MKPAPTPIATIPGTAARRILVVAPQPFYEDRGTPIAVRLVLEALSELGHQVDVLTFPQGRDIEIPGVRFFRIGNPLRIRQVPIGFSLRKLVLDSWLVPALRRQLRSRPYHCVHAVEEAAFPAVLLARRAGIPVIYDMQSSLPEQLAQRSVFRISPVLQALRRCERWLLRRADSVMSSAGLAASVVAREPGVQVNEWTFPSRLRRPGHAEIAWLRRHLDIHPAARTIVYCGTFEAYQGLGHLLGAIPRVHAEAPEAVFVLVGGSEAEKAAVLRSARAEGIDRSLRVVERQPQDAIAAFLGMADVLVSSRSYGGNLPLKIFDYLAAGRPIVATDIPTHRSVLDHGRAVLVPPTAEGLAEGICHVLADPQHASRLAEGARDYADLHFGWDRFVERVGKLYDEVCVHG